MVELEGVAAQVSPGVFVKIEGVEGELLRPAGAIYRWPAEVA